MDTSKYVLTPVGWNGKYVPLVWCSGNLWFGARREIYELWCQQSTFLVQGRNKGCPWRQTPRVTRCGHCFVAVESIYPNCAVPASCTVFLYYRKILNVSNIYLGHPQRVTNLVDMCIYGNLSLIFGRVCLCVLYITNNTRVLVAVEVGKYVNRYL
jgi:hypothetical protein